MPSLRAYMFARVQVVQASFLAFPRQRRFLQKILKVNNLLVEANDAINIRLWQLGEQTDNAHKTDRQTKYSNPWPRPHLSVFILETLPFVQKN